MNYSSALAWLRRRLCVVTKITWFLVAAAIAVTSLSVNAQEKQWLFEIEVLLFKRDLDPSSISEQFPDDQVVEKSAAINLLTAHLVKDLSWTRDSLPYCFKAPPPPPELPDIGFKPNPILSDPAISTERLAVYEVLKEVVIADPLYPEIQTIEQVPGLELYKLEPETPQSLSGLNDDDLSSNDALNGFGNGDAMAFDEIPVEPFNVTLDPLPKGLPDTLACVFESEQLQFDIRFEENPAPEVVLSEVPKTINGVEWVFSDPPYLIAETSLQLTDLANSIAKQKGTTPLLHLGWRQEVLFGQDRAPFYRLFGGINYAQSFDAEGLPLIATSEEPLSFDEELDDSFGTPTQPDLIDEIKRALADPDYVVSPDIQDLTSPEVQQRVAELWELDGLFKVFLRYIQGVPYLHIESQLDFRAPVAAEQIELGTDPDEIGTRTIVETQLQAFQFSQLRRVISKQVHYFDHPLFGMVVQIRRFEKPLREESDEVVQAEEASNN